jgi:hypothetical protein
LEFSAFSALEFSALEFSVFGIFSLGIRGEFGIRGENVSTSEEDHHE